MSSDPNTATPYCGSALTGQDLTTPPRGRVEEELAEWVNTLDGESVNSIVRVEKLRREYRDEYAELWQSMKDDTRRRVLAEVHNADGLGVDYDDLQERISGSHSTIQRRVRRLEDAGLVARLGRPVVVKYESDDLRVLAGDVLAAYYTAG